MGTWQDPNHGGPLPGSQPIIINNNTEPPPPPPPENVTIINNQVHPVNVGQPVYGARPIDPYGYPANGSRYCYRCQQNRWVYTEPRYTPGIRDKRTGSGIQYLLYFRYR